MQPMQNVRLTMAERVRRLNPTPQTLRRLFALSQNRCAFEGCTHPVIDQDGGLLAEVCHIEAANQTGQRFNPAQTNEDRRQFENLILLCRNHHRETDDVERFPTSVMKQMKAVHDSKASAVGMTNGLAQERFVDQSAYASLQLPMNFQQLDLSLLEDTFFPDARKIMEAVARLPSLTRSLYAHALANSHAWPNDLSIYCDPFELTLRLDHSYEKLKPHFSILETNGLIWFPEYRTDWTHPNTPGFRSYFRQFDKEDNGIYFLLLATRRFEREKEVLVDIFENLNFQLLDT